VFSYNNILNHHAFFNTNRRNINNNIHLVVHNASNWKMLIIISFHRTPSYVPSGRPSSEPSSKPSVQPSATPSNKPSAMPSLKPSTDPSSQPSSVPSLKPSFNTIIHHKHTYFKNTMKYNLHQIVHQNLGCHQFLFYHLHLKQ